MTLSILNSTPLCFSSVICDLGMLLELELTFARHIGQADVLQLLLQIESTEGHCSLLDFQSSSLPRPCICAEPPWLLWFQLRWSPTCSDREVGVGPLGCGWGGSTGLWYDLLVGFAKNHHISQ